MPLDHCAPASRDRELVECDILISAGGCWVLSRGRMSDVNSSLSATTHLPASHHQLSHPRLAVDNIFPASAPGTAGNHGDEGMIELKDIDEAGGVDEHRGWSWVSRREMTSLESPLFLTPVTFHDNDWQLLDVRLRMNIDCFECFTKTATYAH